MSRPCQDDNFIAVICDAAHEFVYARGTMKLRVAEAMRVLADAIADADDLCDVCMWQDCQCERARDYDAEIKDAELDRGR